VGGALIDRDAFGPPFSGLGAPQMLSALAKRLNGVGRHFPRNYHDFRFGPLGTEEDDHGRSRFKRLRFGPRLFRRSRPVILLPSVIIKGAALATELRRQ